MYKRKRKFNKTRKILSLVIIVLIVILGFKAYGVINSIVRMLNPFEPTVYVNSPAKQAITQLSINKDKELASKFKMTFIKTSEQIVLKGDRQIQKTYSSDDRDINATKKQGGMAWFVNKFKDLKVREITINATYRFEYCFNFSLIEPSVRDGKLHIILSRGQLYLNPLAELPNMTFLSYKNQIFSDEFKPQEVTAIMNRTLISVMNNINADEKLKQEAMDSAVDNIKSIAAKLGVKDVEVEVFGEEGIKNNEVDVL